MCLCKGNLGAWRTLHYQATTRHAAVSLTWYIPSLKRPAKGLCLLRKLHSRQTTLQRDKPITTLNLIPQYLNVNPASLLLCPFSLSIDSKVENSHLSSILPCSVGYILDSHLTGSISPETAWQGFCLSFSRSRDSGWRTDAQIQVMMVKLKRRKWL